MSEKQTTGERKNKPGERWNLKNLRSRMNVKRMVLLAMFIAIIVLLGFTPLGMIPLPLIKASILATPVVIGTLLMGWQEGLLLGFAFGCVSAYTALTAPSGLVAPLMGKPGTAIAAVIVMCILPRVCIPLVAWGVNRFLEKNEQKPGMSFLASAGCGAVVNALVVLMGSAWFADLGMETGTAKTVAVLLGIALNLGIGYLMFRLMNMKGKAAAVAAVCGSMTNTVLYLGTMLLLFIICGLNSAGVLSVIGGTALMAGSAEAVLAAIICPPVVAALRKLK